MCVHLGALPSVYVCVCMLYVVCFTFKSTAAEGFQCQCGAADENRWIVRSEISVRRACMNIWLCVCACVRVCVCACVCVCVCMCHTCTHTHTHTNRHTRRLKHTHSPSSQTHTHTHTHTQTLLITQAAPPHSVCPRVLLPPSSLLNLLSLPCVPLS